MTYSVTRSTSSIYNSTCNTLYELLLLAYDPVAKALVLTEARDHHVLLLDLIVLQQTRGLHFRVLYLESVHLA